MPSHSLPNEIRDQKLSSSRQGMQITAVIPIRGGSQRCKNKSIRPFHDTTLLDLRIDTLKKVRGIHKIQVNSDCDVVLARAKELGVETFKRDPKYASNEANGKMLYECLSEACPTEIMLIAFTPTPFIGEKDYQHCIDVFLQGDCDSVISVQHKKDYMFYEKKPVNFDHLNTCKSQDLAQYFSMTFGVTILSTEYVRRNHSIWTENPHFYEVDELKALDIDTNMDFFLCEQLYKRSLSSLKLMNQYFDKQETLRDLSTSVSVGMTIPDDVYLGAVYDALNTLVDDATKYVLDIKPAAGYQKLIHGPAFTITGAHVNATDDFDELDSIRYTMYKPELFENHPIVMLGVGCRDSKVAHFGDITCQVYKKLGAVGLVTDGIGRDIDLINSLRFPAFCNTVNPADALEKWAYVDFQKPIFMDQKNIYPGDYVFADSDGVIVIPKSFFAEFQIALHGIMEKERSIRKFLDEISVHTLDTSVRDFVDKSGRF